MASGILLQFRRAPLHVLRILLYSAFFMAWLVYCVLLGFYCYLLMYDLISQFSIVLSVSKVFFKKFLSKLHNCTCTPKLLVSADVLAFIVST